IIYTGERKRFRSRLNSPEIFHKPLCIRPCILTYHGDGQVHQFTLKRVSEDKKINNRHKYTHRKNNGIAPEFFEVSFYYRKQSCHFNVRVLNFSLFTSHAYALY